VKVALLGLPGSGKTTVGRALANMAGRPFVDLDEAISKRAGEHPASLIDRLGEADFRHIEMVTLHHVAEGQGVLALGGGTLDDPLNSRRLGAWRLIWLDPSLTTLVRRLSDTGDRPLLRGNVASRLEALDVRRRPIFARVAEARFGGEGDPTTVAREIKDYLDTVDALGGRLYWGVGSRRHLGAFDFGRSGAVVARTLDAWRGDLARALPDVPTTDLDDREEAKTLDSVGRLYRWGSEQHFDRTSTVYAVGGGVTTDLAGFFAATYLRGLPLVDVPTTLLASVDAAIGGKVGVDLPEGKNLVGSFHPPRATVVDPDFWGTLPPRALSEAMAEVVKTALIEGEDALAELEELGWPATPERLDPIARRAARVKLQIVQADPREEAERTYLNLGHTAGHALEQATGYRVSHGRAVAIGLMAILRFQEERGGARLAARVGRLLDRFGLPTAYEIDPSRLIGPMGLDKKRSEGGRRLVLLERPGRPFLTPATATDLEGLAKNVLPG